MDVIRVLLVDDDQSYYKLTSRMLARADHQYEVEWASDYDSGLQASLRKEHDVYLLDYHLGQHSGLELMRVAQARGVTAPFIMLTGEARLDTDIESLEAGASDYLDKTELKPANLQRAIRYALSQASAIRSLRQSEDSYRSLIEEAFDGILLTDSEGRILLANSRLCEMIGCQHDQLEGTSVSDLIQPASDNGAPLLPIDEGRVQEYALKRADDTTLDIEVSAKPISGDRLQFIIRDITGRKASLQERDRYIEQLTVLRQVDDELSQILSIDYVLIMALDSSVRLSGANAGFIGLIDGGRVRLAQTIGHYADLSPGEFLPDTPFVQRLIEDMEPRLIPDVSQEPDYVVVNEKTKAQMLLPLTSYERLIGILNVETNHPERFTQEAFDFLSLITARVAVAVENAQLYEIAQNQLTELQELYEQVSGLEKLKTDMIRIAAHDLRNPISVILGYSELLRRDIGDNADLTEHVDMINESAVRLEKITTSILSLERIENLKIDHAEVLDLNELVKEVYNELQRQAQACDQVYELELPPVSVFIKADRIQIHEAVANLITNAIKYTPSQGRITVRLRQQDRQAVLEVQDTGFGIPDDEKGRLFKPFSRARIKEAAGIEGTGLGLYLIKSIVERYNGEIVFQSEYGSGSTFGFRLPALAETEAQKKSSAPEG